MAEQKEPGLFRRLIKELGVVKSVLFILLGLVIIASLIWSGKENQKLAGQTVNAVYITKGMWKVEFPKGSGPAAFEKSIIKFSDDTGTRIKIFYTLPKEMWPDPEKPVVYIYTEAFEDHKPPAVYVPTVRIDPPKPYTK